MSNGVKMVCLCLLLSMSITVQADELLQKKVDTLQEYVESEKYEQAYNLLGVLRTDIYEAMLEKDEPEVIGNAYRNYYYQFSIVNPVAEWKIEEIAIADSSEKRKRQLMRDLVKIKNVASPYGLVEQIVVSVYDVGKSPEATLVEALDFKPHRYLKSIAEKILKQHAGVDTELIVKEEGSMAGNPAYLVVTETDMGFKEAVRLLHYYVYVEQKQFVLLFSFIMHSENYSIYKHVFDEIVDQVQLGAVATNDILVVEQESFMDIYLERSQKAV